LAANGRSELEAYSAIFLWHVSSLYYEGQNFPLNLFTRKFLQPTTWQVKGHPYF